MKTFTEYVLDQSRSGDWYIMPMQDHGAFIKSETGDDERPATAKYIPDPGEIIITGWRDKRDHKKRKSKDDALTEALYEAIGLVEDAKSVPSEVVAILIRALGYEV